MQSAGDIQRRKERDELVRVLLDKVRSVPDGCFVPDDGSRAVELESALAARQQAGYETNDASARAALTAAQRGDARSAERWFCLPRSIESMAALTSDNRPQMPTVGASECFQRAKDAYDEIGRSEGLGRSLAGLGMVAVQRGASEEAQAYWVQAREHFEDVGMVAEAAAIEERMLRGLQ